MKQLLAMTRSLGVEVVRCELCLHEATLTLRHDPRWASLFGPDGELIRSPFLLLPFSETFRAEIVKLNDALPEVPCLYFSYDDETLAICVEHLRKLTDHVAGT